MIIRSDKDPGVGWTSLHNDTLEDENLPWDALGLLAYILRKPDDWTISVEHLGALRGAGRDKIKRMLRDLESAGYLHRIRGRNEKGHWDWTRKIYDRSQVRQTSISDSEASDGSAGDGSAIDGKPANGENDVSGDSAKDGSAVNGSSSNGPAIDGKPADITSTDITTTTSTPLARTRKDSDPPSDFDPVAYLEDRWHIEVSAMQAEDLRHTVTDNYDLWRRVVDRFRRQDKAKRPMLHYALEDYQTPGPQDLPDHDRSTNNSQQNGRHSKDPKHDPEAAFRETLAILSEDS